MRILLYGDSITSMGRQPEAGIGEIWNYGSGYPFVIQSELTKDNPIEHQVINRGVGGNRIVDLYARIKSDVWNLKPDVLSILIGINDIWHEIGSQNGVELDRFEKVYDMLIEDTLKVLPNLKIVLLEPFVLKGAATEEKYEQFLIVKEYAKVVKKLAEKYNAYFIPLQDEFNKRAEKYGEHIYLYDGVHTNVAGATLIGNKWVDFFKKNIEAK